MTWNTRECFAKISHVTSHQTYSTKNGCTKVFQTLLVKFVLEFGHSLNIFKNLDVWESIYGPKHKEMFPKGSQITGHKTASSKNGRT